MSLTYLRDRAMPAFHDVQESDDPIALTFVVNDPKNTQINEDDVFDAAIHAMLAVFDDESPLTREAVEAWLNGRIRKIVKRARNKAWDDLADLPEFVAEATSGNATVRVFRPLPISQFPEPVRKLQVSGLQFDVTARRSNGPALEIFIDESLNMSTGKLVAQTAHAAQLFLMYGPAAQVEAWLSTNAPVTSTRLPDFKNLPEVTVAVHDAGFTEVAANSNTTAARYLS